MIRMLNPGFAYMLLPWYLDEFDPIEKTCCRLYREMKNCPNETFCGVEVEDDKITGIALAYTEGDNLFVWQINSKDFKKTKECLIDYGKMMGCKTASMRTSRNPKAWERLCGFKVDNKEVNNGKTVYTMSRAI